MSVAVHVSRCNGASAAGRAQLRGFHAGDDSTAGRSAVGTATRGAAHVVDTRSSIPHPSPQRPKTTHILSTEAFQAVIASLKLDLGVLCGTEKGEADGLRERLERRQVAEHGEQVQVVLWEHALPGAVAC